MLVLMLNTVKVFNQKATNLVKQGIRQERDVVDVVKPTRHQVVTDIGAGVCVKTDPRHPVHVFQPRVSLDRRGVGFGRRGSGRLAWLALEN